MEAAWTELKQSVSLANRLNKTDAELGAFHNELKDALHQAVTRCRVERKRKRAEAPQLDLSDESILRAARFTDHLPLADYAEILHLTPRLVNVVTLAEAVPVQGSGLTLPLDLHAIAARCTNAYYAPRRFAAVQFAFNNPRCRVLIFHTGRFVGTGCSGPMQARMAILKAARQLAVEANVHVHIRKFSVINQVGAVGIDAKLDCDAFASTHSATSHYDRASFVGMRVWCGPLTGHSLDPFLHCTHRSGMASRWRAHLLRNRAPAPPLARRVRLTRPVRVRSIVLARLIYRARRASATCSLRLRAWSRSCCGTATSPKCANASRNDCGCVIGPST